MQASWQTDGFLFHHGHCAAEDNGRVQVIGHHHPAGKHHGWGGTAAEVAGVRATGELLDSASVFALGGGGCLEGGGGCAHVGLHAGSHFAAAWWRDARRGVLTGWR
jgi:hypothetical protein